jgi:hypothetical protein
MQTRLAAGGMYVVMVHGSREERGKGSRKERKSLVPGLLNAAAGGLRRSQALPSNLNRSDEQSEKQKSWSSLAVKRPAVYGRETKENA